MLCWCVDRERMTPLAPTPAHSYHHTPPSVVAARATTFVVLRPSPRFGHVACCSSLVNDMANTFLHGRLHGLLHGLLHGRRRGPHRGQRGVEARRRWWRPRRPHRTTRPGDAGECGASRGGRMSGGQGADADVRNSPKLVCWCNFAVHVPRERAEDL